MTRSEYSQFMKDQAETIKRDRWIDSEIAGFDLSNFGYDILWIYRNGRIFRQRWLRKRGISEG